MAVAQAESEMASKGLKGGSLGLVAVTVIAIASTAPGYSLAAGIGGIAGKAGVHAPFIMLFAFAPMACIAAAFYYMNKADPDCGTNFTWGVRAFGPYFGWLSGWACIVADLVIMPNLAGVSGQYLVLLFDKKAADNIYLTTFIGILFIVAMCWICWKGIELSARSQVLLLGTELVVLTIFAIVAFSKSFGGGITKAGDALAGDDLTAAQGAYPACSGAGKVTQSCFDAANSQVVYHSLKPSLSWMWFTGVSAKDILAGLVLAVFIYWGWDTAVSVNEESTDANHTPGVAAVLSTFLLLAIYLVTSYGSVSLLGPGFTSDNSSDALYALGNVALPSILLKLLIIAVLTSASASCQTTILPATRTMLSMGVHKAVPDKLGEVDTKNLTPAFSTWLFGAVSIVWYLFLVVISHNTSTDLYSSSIGAVGMAIALYYGFTGISCIWYYRRWLTRSVKNFFLIGVLPVWGGIVLVYAFFATIRDNVGADGDHALLFTGTGLLIAGVPFMIWCRFKYPTFFGFRPDPPGTVPDPSDRAGTLAAELGTYAKGATR
jgi:amino acid transporter